VANTGNKYPGTTGTVTRTSATTWTNPENIVSDNTTDATCADSTGNGSYYLVASNFGLSLSSLHTIRGITVVVQASEHSTGTEVLNAQLQDASGALFGGSKTATISGTTKTNYTYGSTSDLWSATLTPAIVNDADFGVRLWFTTSHDLRIDFVRITVEYSEGIQYGLGQLTAAGYAPSFNFGFARDIPAAAALTAAGYAPAIDVTVQDVRVSYARFDTAFTTGSSIEAPTGQLTAAGYSPVLDQTRNIQAAPGAGELTAAGIAPMAATTAHQWITSGVGAVSSAGSQPTISQTANHVVTVPAGELSINGNPPSLNTATVDVRVSFARLDAALPPVLISYGRALMNLSGFSPATVRTTDHYRTIGLGEVTADGYAPDLTGNIRAFPGAGEVTVEGFAPVAHLSTMRSPGVGQVTVQGFAPTAYHGASDVRVSWVSLDTQAGSRAIGVAELIFQGYPPAIGAIVIGGSGYRRLSWTASVDPNVTGYYVYWDTSSRGDDNYLDYANSADVSGRGTENYTVTALIPGQMYYFNISAHGAGGHDQFESGLFGETNAEGLESGLVISGHAPVVARTVAVLRVPGVGEVTVTGYPLTVNQSAALPQTAALLAEGFAPTLGQTANHFSVPGTGDVTAEGLVALIEQSIINAPTVKTGEMTILGFAPTVANAVSCAPGVGEITAAGFAPTVGVTIETIIFPGTAEGTLDGFAPVVVRADMHLVTTDAPENITFEGFAPVLLQAGAFSIGPGPAAVVIEGYAPDLSIGGRRTEAGGRKKRRKWLSLEDWKTLTPKEREAMGLPEPEEEPEPAPQPQPRRIPKPVPVEAPALEPVVAQAAAPPPPVVPPGLSGTEYMLMVQAAQAALERENGAEMELIFAALAAEDRERRERLSNLLRRAQEIMELDGDNDPEMWYMKRR
jgi:hypothetical protein